MKQNEIKIRKTSNPKEKPDAEKIAFGTAFTDHMFTLDYSKEKGWHDPQIIPYEPLQLDPAAIIFHYGQTVFEGLKAYKTNDEEIRLFRPDENMKRLNRSAKRMCMPQIDEHFALHALNKLVETEKNWVPSKPGTSLYVRPFMIATEPYLGVAPSTKYKFMIILSPVGSYYKEGISPVRILVENEYVRAVSGGTGTAKTAGNYASSLKAQETAEAEGYAQVLWLDGIEKKYVEEVGSMNVFFKIKGEIITPSLNGSILEGITRKSIIELLNHWNIPVTERKISMEEVITAHKKGELDEAFGTGTAAVISPIGEFNYLNEKFVVNEGKTGEISKKLYDELTGIQLGRIKDPFNWVVTLS